MNAEVVTVRTFESADARSIAVLIRQLGYAADETFITSRLALLASSANDRIYVAECRARIVGLLSFHVFPLFHEPACLGRITALVVKEDSRGRGVGRALIEAAETFAWKVGCSRVEVTSGDSRSGAHAFYETVGYHRSHQRFLKMKPS